MTIGRMAKKKIRQQQFCAWNRFGSRKADFSKALGWWGKKELEWTVITFDYRTNCRRLKSWRDLMKLTSISRRRTCFKLLTLILQTCKLFEEKARHISGWIMTFDFDVSFELLSIWLPTVQIVFRQLDNSLTRDEFSLTSCVSSSIIRCCKTEAIINVLKAMIIGLLMLLSWQ